jgi:hypothetical protein
MRPVTANFKAAVSGSHRMNVRATVLTTPGQHGTAPTGTVIPVTQGSATFDTTANVLGSFNLMTSQSWPVNYQDLLSPYGNEMFLERGVVYAAGSTEWVSLGYFRVNDVEQQDAPAGLVQVAGVDRMQGIVDARIPSPITFVVGTTVSSIIQYLVTDVYSWATYQIDASLTSAVLSVNQITTDDRYGFLHDLITSYGMIWYWDYRGVLVVTPPPSLSSPVATILTGRQGVMVSMFRGLSRDGVYSGCVATGQQVSDGTAPFALVVDTNTTSPTYWYGPFGKVPKFYSSSFLTTNAQCASAAQSILTQSTGLPYEVDFGMIPNPALMPWDPVMISTDLGGIQTETHILKQMVIGLGPGDSMTAQTRQLVNGQFNVIG